MLALVIDTSSAAVTAAVVDLAPAGADGSVSVLAQRVTVDARAHGELLAPQIGQCLAEAGIGPRRLDCVVAGLGPGPFTGLRVGLVTAAMFGDLLGIATYGVCSLDALALGADAPAGVAVLAAGDARRREIYWARYEGGIRTSGPQVHRPGELPGLGRDRLVVGAGARLYSGTLGGHLLDCDFPPPGALAVLAVDRARDGEPSERLVPLYLRRPDAVAPADYKPVTPS